MSLTIVSGFQRCGSSAMCQMLHAGGMPIYHDPEMGFPSFETMKQFHEANDPSWLLPLDGYGMKWLEPQHAMPPPLPYEIRVIWMSRNVGQQAQSAVKFMTHVGGYRLPPGTAKKLRASYIENTPKALALWRERGEVLVERFEEICYRPGAVARRVQQFLGVPLDVDAMAAAIIGRDDRCLPGFLEIDLIARHDSREVTKAANSGASHAG